MSELAVEIRPPEFCRVWPQAPSMRDAVRAAMVPPCRSLCAADVCLCEANAIVVSLNTIERRRDSDPMRITAS